MSEGRGDGGLDHVEGPWEEGVVKDKLIKKILPPRPE